MIENETQFEALCDRQRELNRFMRAWTPESGELAVSKIEEMEQQFHDMEAEFQDYIDRRLEKQRIEFRNRKRRIGEQWETNFSNLAIFANSELTKLIKFSQEDRFIIVDLLVVSGKSIALLEIIPTVYIVGKGRQLDKNAEKIRCYASVANLSKCKYYGHIDPMKDV